MTSEEILARIADTYASAPRYSDTGKMVINEGRGEFRTAFDRTSEALCFEGRILEHDHLLDVRDGVVTRLTRRSVDGLSVAQAIGYLTGVTFGAARVIPRLLWPNIVAGQSILDSPSCLVRANGDRAELILTRFPAQLVVDTATWLITSFEMDLGGSTIATSYIPSL